VIVDGLAVDFDPRVPLECVLARQSDPELRLETAGRTPEESAAEVIDWLAAKNLA